MKTICLLFLVIGGWLSHPSFAQPYSIVIKGGHVINPKNNIDEVMDVAGHKIEGKQKLEAEMTIRKGRIVYDLNGIANPVIVTQQPRS